MICIICAMDVEAELLKAEMTDKRSETVSGIEFVRGSLRSKETVVAVCGIGKVNAAVCTQSAILKYSPSLIINSGVAGNLSFSIGVGDLAVADFAVEHDFDLSPLGDPVGMIPGLGLIKIPCDKRASELLAECARSCADTKVIVGTVASGDRFINDRESKERIVSAFDACVCEMEGASIGHVCRLNGVPFALLRCVSDNADGSSLVDYPEFVGKASNKAASVIISFMEKW